MRTVPFQSVLHGTARLLGMNPTRDLGTERAATLTEYLNTVVKPAWQFDWFPEWTTCERRQFRQNYTSGEFLNAGDQRYHIASDAYYQALVLQLAATQAPATPQGGGWLENSAYWAELESCYDAALQEDGEDLAVGDQRKDVDSGITYQIHTAHTAVGTTVDTTKAGALTDFHRTIDFEQEGQTLIGTLKQVCQRDPRVYPTRPGRLNHRLTGSGLVIVDSCVPNRVWLEFRLRPPQFTSELWVQPASGQGYDLNDLVYYNAGVFKSLKGDNESPTENGEDWEYIGFPEILQQHCQLAAAALLLTDQKQNARAAKLQQEAKDELERVREQEITSQQEPETAEVFTYGR